MERVKFKKGKQKEFFDKAIQTLNCTTLKDLLQYGIDTTYSSLKNYYTERRLMPRNLLSNYVI